MAISPEMVDRIRQAVDIVDIIGSYVPLKRAGASYKALSPFNKEKSPSFYVNPQRQIFKCFSSGHGGDVFKFLMLYESLDFPTAVRRLAEKAGIPLEEERTGDYQKAAARKQKLLALHQDIALYWRDLLLHDERAKVARDYMHHREIPLSWVKDFGLGFAPESWDDTIQWAKKKDYSEAMLLEAGLAKRQEDSGRAYDFFRGRLVFNIEDEQGQVIAFSARLMDKEAKAAKYINSPDSPLFSKSKVLFGFHRAKRAILDAGAVVVCEGQIDVLRCHASGILHAVAPLGTAFTEEHAKQIKRFTQRVILCLDADRAGQQAADRVTKIFLEGMEGMERMVQSDLGVEVVRLPAGHDPDSIIMQEGVEAFKSYLAKPMQYVDFLLDRLMEKEDAGTASGKRKVIEAAAAFLTQIPNQSYRAQILQQAAARLQISQEVLESEVTRNFKPAKFKSNSAASFRNRDNEEPKAEKLKVLEVHPLVADLIQVCLSHNGGIPEIQKVLSPEWVMNLAGAGLLQRMMELYNDEVWSDQSSIYRYLEPEEQNYLTGLDTAGLQDMELAKVMPIAKRACVRLHLDWIRNRLLVLSQLRNQPELNSAQKAEILAEERQLYKLKNSLTAST
ncbi:MAG: DNA primase [Blastochloris sp.]|nr:DNA primase [Blastochloris sp.]